MLQKVPLYYHIMESIRDDIINNVYPIGALLPTETELEQQFSVSKITIRKAIELLENDGYIKKKSGYGTTVVSNSVYNKLSKGASFSSILQQHHQAIEKRDTKMEKVTLKKDTEAATFFPKQAIKLSRGYFLNDTPYIYAEHFLPAKLKIANTIDDANFSLYMFLYKNEYFIQRFEDFFIATIASTDIAEKLQIAPDTPLLVRKRITYDNNNHVIELAYSYYNSSLYPYQINYEI